MPNRNELALTGEGVAPLEIDEIDKAISKYQRQKTKRCEASPGEIEAKTALRVALHAHRDELSKNADGVPFYRYDDCDSTRDYLLDDKLIIRKVQAEDDDE